MQNTPDLFPIPLYNIQLMLKSLNKPFKLLSQLHTPIHFLTLMLFMFYHDYLNCKCAKILEDSSQSFNNESITKYHSKA